MSSLPYLIVGGGISGELVALELEKRGFQSVLIDSGLENCSKVAAGMFSPISGRGFSPTWNFPQFYNAALKTYTELENLSGQKIYHRTGLIKPFLSNQERNNWLVNTPYKAIAAEDTSYGAGLIEDTGFIDVPQLLSIRKAYSQKTERRTESFRHYDCEVSNDHISYQGIKYQAVIFCEGKGIARNPFFKNFPLIPSKGQIIEVEAADFKLRHILWGKPSIIPIGDQRFKIGSTYENEYISEEPDENGKETLLNRLQQNYSGDFKILSHKAGVRATLADRRPVIGKHPFEENTYILNGLGSKGVLFAPLLANLLVQNILEGQPVSEMISVNRLSKFLKPI